MTGWLIALTLAGLTFALLKQSNKLSRQALEIVLAALIVALAGYGWQGSPDMAGKPIAVSPAEG